MSRHLRKGRHALKARRQVAYDNLAKRFSKIEKSGDEKKLERATIERNSLKASL